ncbi:MAG: DJ-1/PfpI family protein [Bacteroidota bacterium]
MLQFRLYVNTVAGFMLAGILIVATACAPAESVTEAASRIRVMEEMALADAAEAAGGDVLNVGFVVLEGVYNSELMAPYDVIQHSIFRDSLRYMQPFIVAPSLDPVVTFEGIEVVPHFTFDTHPDIDVLIVPSTVNSMTADLEDKVFMSWLTETVDAARYVITVCDGAFPLAATGVLDGRIATTFPGDRDRFAAMFPSIDVRYEERFVVDGKYITSVGGAMSYEPAFYLVEHVYSKSHADKTASGLVWGWDLEQVPHLIVESP